MSDLLAERKTRSYKLEPYTGTHPRTRGVRTLEFDLFTGTRLRGLLGKGESLLLRPPLSIRKKPFNGTFNQAHLQYFNSIASDFGCSISLIARLSADGSSNALLFSPDGAEISNVPKFIESDPIILAGCTWNVSRLVLVCEPGKSSYWAAEITRYGCEPRTHPLNLRPTPREYFKRTGREARP